MAVPQHSDFFVTQLELTGNTHLIYHILFRLNDLVATGDGLAILDQGLSLGGGALQNFGINSNTSANGFIKCLYKKQTNVVAIQAASPPPQKAMPAGSPVP